MANSSKTISNLSIISANVRGFQTNIGDLTHSFIIPKNADIVACVETFLNENIPENYGRIPGYSGWHRRDRVSGNFGGIAVCFREGLSFQALDICVPDHLELSFFRLWTKADEAMLFCVCYRPQWQGAEPVEFLRNNLDVWLHQYSCKHIMIVGDMNQYLIARSFEEFLITFGLQNHISFPTHISGSSLDPVITDFSENITSCQALGYVGSSDHQVIYTNIGVEMNRDKAISRTVWLWDRANWQGFRRELESLNWDNILRGSVTDQVRIFTDLILALQEIYVPHKTFTIKPNDQPWFGPRCREAADDKSRAWTRYKRCPSIRNKNTYTTACREMKKTQKWAKKRWLKEIRHKLSGRSVGSREWWSLVKTQQGFVPDETIPPLNKPDGTVTTSAKEKAELLASYFASKMTVPDISSSPPTVPLKTNKRLSGIIITEEGVMQQLLNINVKKSLGPDGISPYTIKRCAHQLTTPLTHLFKLCLKEQEWPHLWKWARVVALHKKNSKSSVKNYRPVSLLSVIGKVFEKIIAEEVTCFIDQNSLLSDKQFGFRKKRSTSDLLLQLSTSWHKSLEKGNYTYVIALDIAGAFDRVWHKGIVAKLKSFGIAGDLLMLLENYLKGRTLRVVVNGYTSNDSLLKQVCLRAVLLAHCYGIYILMIFFTLSLRLMLMQTIVL